MKMEKRLILPLILSAALTTMFLASFAGTARAVTSTQLVIQPSSGSYLFCTGYTTPPATLTYNITVLNVVNISAWQVGIQWNSSVLGYNTTLMTSASLFPIYAIDDSQSATGLIVAGGQQGVGATPLSGNLTVAQLELNLNATPPASSSITFEGLQSGGDTFLLNGLLEIPFTPVTSMFSYGITPGTPETHSISGTANLVYTYSNATIQQNTATINTTSKTIAFNATGNTGDTAYLYLNLPKNVINCTDIPPRWNITLNGVKYGMSSSAFQILVDNATLTFLYIPSFTFSSQANVGVQGNNVIPELPNVLLILLIASSVAVAMMKVRTKKKI